MGSRSDSFMGLTDKAEEIITDMVMVKVKEEVTYPDGKTETNEFERAQSRVKTEEYDEHSGMFGDPYPLHKYTMPDGTMYRDFVQDEPWSSGPVFFYALEKYDEKDETWKIVKESLWSDEEINAHV